MIRSAIVSDCEKFRYALARQWDAALPSVAFVMLNPSTADALVDDPTIRKCVGFAKRLGFGSIHVVNLKAWRSTSPKGFAQFPAGIDNLAHVVEASRRSRLTICAWGRNARRMEADGMVTVLRDHCAAPMALRLAADGTPWHPLMLPYSCTPVEMP